MKRYILIEISNPSKVENYLQLDDAVKSIIESHTSDTISIMICSDSKKLIRDCGILRD